ncbi:MAG: hypothetical protein M3Y75_01180 [Actinomycetota bacterium]|nr:hypothetical protein [Actinomycetota bacterium]
MNRAEAQQIAQAELEREREKGYEELRRAAPRVVGESRRFLGLLRQKEWEAPEGHRVTETRAGPSGTSYFVEREVDWDDSYGGALRLWVYVHDGESAEHPESATSIVESPA